MVEEVVSIKVSKTTHSRLTKDKEYFTKAIGLNFSYNATIVELYKIIDSYTENK